MKRTFIDSGVLISAARGTEPLSETAIRVIDDPNRIFVSSDFIKLEVLPKAKFHRNLAEEEFYACFFESVDHWVEFSREIIETAFNEATRAGLSALDAFHVAIAKAAGADELITTEKPTKPLHRVSNLKVVSIYPST